jgi:hypothetical protein
MPAERAAFVSQVPRQAAGATCPAPLLTGPALPNLLAIGLRGRRRQRAPWSLKDVPLRPGKTPALSSPRSRH